ncbi:MAG: DUF4250 domain-containing protein [Clostridia bacterium]|nr:DUF4250 domain-containing protein [Clostridia bacterium]
MLPSDPYMLLSALNMKLRDGDSSLEELCDSEDASLEEVVEKLSSIGYIYNKEQRKFISV